MEAIGSTELLIILILFSAVIAVYIIFLLTLQSVLNEINRENRTMRPAQVWLMLIPLFNIVWSFIVVTRIADSLDKEFEDRGINPGEERPGYTVGIMMSVLSIFGIIPVVGGIFSLGAFVCWIIYWVKMSNYKSRLSGLSEIL